MSVYEQIKADLGYLKLDAAAGVFATLAEQAKTEDWSHIEFLARLVAEQATADRDRRLAARLRYAKFPYRRPARIVQLRRSPRGKFAPRDVVHHPQRLEHRDRRRRERAARAVAHLDRDPDPAAPEPDRLDAFGADLGDPVAPPCPTNLR